MFASLPRPRLLDAARPLFPCCSLSVEQWRTEFKNWSTIRDPQIACFTSDRKEPVRSAHAKGKGACGIRYCHFVTSNCLGTIGRLMGRTGPWALHTSGVRHTSEERACVRVLQQPGKGWAKAGTKRGWN